MSPADFCEQLRKIKEDRGRTPKRFTKTMQRLATALSMSDNGVPTPIEQPAYAPIALLNILDMMRKADDQTLALVRDVVRKLVRP